MSAAYSRTFDLSTNKPSKTVDIGSDGTSVSADPLGRILQLSTFHPLHGLVNASAYEQFDGARFYDPEYVRAYRTRMLQMVVHAQPGYGIRLENDHQPHVEIALDGPGGARFEYDLKDGVHVTAILLTRPNGELVQHHIVSSTVESVRNVRYVFDLGISINRASYGQLTEGGPVPIPASENHLSLFDQGSRFTIVNRNLSAHLQGYLLADGECVRLDHSMREATVIGKPIVASFAQILELPPNTSRTLTAFFRVLPTAEARCYSPSPQSLIPCRTKIESIWRCPFSDASYIIRRNMEYILGSCAIPVSDRMTCLITDHVALPLGWNRDNYWQVRFLLDICRRSEILMHPAVVGQQLELIRATVKGHLKWVYDHVQRPKGFWHRSYLANGVPKDGPIFQLDQQCYPLLELCDFFESFPDEESFVRKILDGSTVREVVDYLKGKQDKATGLYPTDETPGDDAVEHPYHFSSHVLLWYTFDRLAKLVHALNPPSEKSLPPLDQLAEAVRCSSLKHFHTANSTCDMFAYLVDGQGERQFYHDANDIPTLYACEWGYLQSAEAVQAWKATMDFAMSETNQGGYYVGGPFAGLGSVHTPGPWPLGFFQEFVYAQMRGNEDMEADAWRRIRGTMLWDGLFSEAVDAGRGECTSKGWFSWPGAMIGSALLRDIAIEKYLLR